MGASERAMSQRRRADRGATLIMFVVATGLVITALAAALLSAAEKAFEQSILREREAKLFAAADAGIAEALVRAAREGRFTVDRDGARVSVEWRDDRTLVVLAEFPAPISLQRKLEAKVEPGAAGAGPRVVRVSRL